jgi:enoyl-CoA hydratase/carnithine racemase
MVRQRAPERAILGAGLFDPQTALRMGMLDEVSQDAPTLARTRLLELASHPSLAYARTKAALRGILEEALPAWTSPETKERILAVLKR